jgi:hypothetical protein
MCFFLAVRVVQESSTAGEHASALTRCLALAENTQAQARVVTLRWPHLAPIEIHQPAGSVTASISWVYVGTGVGECAGGQSQDKLGLMASRLVAVTELFRWAANR